MSNKIFKPKYVKKILFNQKAVKVAIAKAANWIVKKYASNKKPPIILAVLKGAIPFYAKLVMNIKMDVIFDFIVVSSFHGEMHATSKPEIVTDIMANIKGRDIIVVDDIMDSARTFSVLIKHLKSKQPKSISTIVLVDKVDARTVPFKVDYACFTLKGNPFIIGCGLDIKEIARNLPYIAEFNKKYYNKI